MRNKNIIVKHFNIRFIKSQIINLLAKSKFLRSKFNIYNHIIDINNKPGNYLTNDYFGDKRIYLIKEIKDILISGKSGTSIDIKTKKIITANQFEKNLKNYIKPILTTNEIYIDEEFDVINLCGIYKGHRHYFHIFFDYLIPLFNYLYNFYDGRKLKIVTRSDLSNIQKQIFKFIEKEFPNINFIHLKNSQRIRCKKSIFIYHNHFVFYNIEKNPKIRAITKLVQNFFYKYYEIEQNTPKKDRKNIYVSRYDVKIRRINNETQLLEKLKKYNFESYQLSKLSFKEQIELFSKANIIVGAHGAGFTNLLFSTEKSKLIEIFSSTFYNKGFSMLGDMMNIKRYEIIEDNGNMFDNFTVKESNMNKILEIIEKNL